MAARLVLSVLERSQTEPDVQMLSPRKLSLDPENCGIHGHDIRVCLALLRT